MEYDCDVIIVGAGIHGAGVAQAVAAAGHTALVLEQTGVASGTSSRSSKLIHGGLRYLEHGEFSLVWECLQERERLLKLAPELVRRQVFHVPVYRTTHRRPWQLRAGLSAYALLAGFGPATGFETVPRRRWQTLDGLRTEGLQAVFRYQDAQTDDVLLTRAVLDSACALGAQLRMPAKFLGAELEPEGVRVTFRSGQQETLYRCRALVNAAGPWVQHVTERIHPAVPRQEIDLVQGTHLLLDLPLEQGIYYLEVPADGRAVFAMPWRDQTLLGTTEIPFSGPDPAQVLPLEQERDYLLAAFDQYFPGRMRRVVGSFAGLRVLPRNLKRPFERAREIILLAHPASEPRIVNVYGGKLTSYRADAEKVLARLQPVLPGRPPRADTRQLRLQRPMGDGT